MSLASDTSYGFAASSARRDIALWGSAALVVLAVHASAGWYLARNLEAPEESAAVEQAMMVDLTPMLETTPEAVESETLSEEEPTEMAAAEEPVETAQAEPIEPVTEEAPPEDSVVQEPTPVEPEQVEPTPAEPEPVEPELVEPEPVEPELVTEELIEEPTVALPDSDVPLPVTRPEPREIVEEKPPVRRQTPEPRKVAEPRVQPKREQPRREQVRREEPRQQREAQKAQPQPRSQASTQQRASSAPKVSPKRWNSQVASMVQRASQRAIRRVRGTGEVLIAFSISGSGAVSNVRVARSSGYPDIDAAVLGAVRGISPPAPPDGSSTSITIPVLKSR
jgi:protein TonB